MSIPYKLMLGLLIVSFTLTSFNTSEKFYYVFSTEDKTAIHLKRNSYSTAANFTQPINKLLIQ